MNIEDTETQISATIDVWKVGGELKNIARGNNFAFSLRPCIVAIKVWFHTCAGNHKTSSVRHVVTHKRRRMR